MERAKQSGIWEDRKQIQTVKYGDRAEYRIFEMNIRIRVKQAAKAGWGFRMLTQSGTRTASRNAAKHDC